LSELPNGWVTIPIGKVTVEIAQREPQIDESFVYIDISSIDRETKRISTPQKMMGLDAPSRARKVVSMTRPNLNAVAMVPWDLDGQIASTGFDVLRAPGLDSRWMFYQVRTTDFVQSMSELVQGALYPAVRSKDIRSFEIPLAPLNEQKRIADKLDALLARVDACRERLDRVPLILKRFRQAVLAAATSGQLTEDWREKNPNMETAVDLVGEKKFKLASSDDELSLLPDNWEWVALGNYAQCSRGRFSVRPRNDPAYFDGKYPFIQIGDFSSEGGWITAHKQTLNEKGLTVSKKFSKGTVVIAIVGATIGNTGILAYDMCFPDSVVGIETGNEISNLYIEFFLRYRKEDIRQISYAGGGQPNIKLELLNPYPLALPPLAEQQEIVRRIQTLFTFVDRLEARSKTARSQVEQLTPALLAKAFRGELVPQDSNDEPASVLLERIRAVRVVAEGNGAKPRRRKTDKSSKAEVIVSKRKDAQPSHLSEVLKNRAPLTAEALFSASQLELNIDDSAV
jgi:type I restriction enzyme, S subunit